MLAFDKTSPSSSGRHRAEVVPVAREAAHRRHGVIGVDRRLEAGSPEEPLELEQVAGDGVR